MIKKASFTKNQLSELMQLCFDAGKNDLPDFIFKKIKKHRLNRLFKLL